MGALARGLSRLLDPTALLSFDRLGYALHAATFKPGDLELDLGGRVFVVTGANSGLGEATARRLAALGGQVRMLCRSAPRGEAARARIVRESGNPDVHLHVVDLSDFEAVRRVAEELPEVHVLVNNAGVLLNERRQAPSGLEASLATNLVGPFLLTALLWPKLAAAERARVIHVASGGMYSARLSTQRMLEPPEPFDGVAAYALHKRAQVVLTQRMAAWGEAAGVEVHAMHPGWADTPGVEGSLPRFYRLTKPILRTPEQGADTIVWLAACEALPEPSGTFWADRRAQPRHLRAATQHAPEAEEVLLEMLFERAGVPRGAFTA